MERKHLDPNALAQNPQAIAELTNQLNKLQDKIDSLSTQKPTTTEGNIVSTSYFAAKGLLRKGFSKLSNLGANAKELAALEREKSAVEAALKKAKAEAVKQIDEQFSHQH